MALITTIQPHMSTCKPNLFYNGFSFRKVNRQDMDLRNNLWVGYQPSSKNRAFSTCPSRMMVSARYAGSEVYTDRVYRRLDSCLVIPPPKGKKPRAIIKFLGGAFVGAVPEVTYSHLIELLAREGYLIISVPYNVTFDHAQAVREIYERFHACLDNILTSGLPDVDLTAEEVAQLPLYSVGHSNGALLQLLTGCYFSEKIPKANAIISFNNRPASEAVPYFEQFGPIVSQMVPVIEASPIYPMARSASERSTKLYNSFYVHIHWYYIQDSGTRGTIKEHDFMDPTQWKNLGDAWKMLLDTAGALIKDYDREAVVSLNKFVDQLPAVMNQVTEGISEFKPTPTENRDCFKNDYSVPHTLLVKFDSDAIDETDVVEGMLKPRVQSFGGTLEKVSLSGNHLTPCIQDPKWQVGYVYTPVDAVAQGLKTLTLNDTRVLARTIVDWFQSLQHP